MVVAGSAYDGGVAIDRDGPTEVVRIVAVGSPQLLLRDPRGAVEAENVCPPGTEVTGAYHGGVAADRDGLAELVAAGRVGGGQLGLFDPAAAVEPVDVGQARLRGVDPTGAYDGGVAADGDGFAVEVAQRGVGGQQLLLFDPAGPVVAEDVGGAVLIDDRLLVGSTYDGRVTIDGDGIPEKVGR